MVNVEDPEFAGGGETLKAKIWEAAKAGIKDWTGGAKLRPSSLYGIRVYKEGAILNSHVDRLVYLSASCNGIELKNKRSLNAHLSLHDAVCRQTSAHLIGNC